MSVVAMSEAQLSKATLDLAKQLGWRVARFPAANFVRTKGGREFVKPLEHDTRGFPDALLVRERLVAVEFKAESGRLSTEQLNWGGWLVLAGVEHHCWRPSDWLSGEIERVLRVPR